MADTITVPLTEPAEYQGKTYAALTFRKLKVRDLTAADLVEGEVRKGVALFASNAGVPLGVIEELTVEDFERVNREAAPLLGKPVAALTGQAADGAASTPTSTP